MGIEIKSFGTIIPNTTQNYPNGEPYAISARFPVHNAKPMKAFFRPEAVGELWDEIGWGRRTWKNGREQGGILVGRFCEFRDEYGEMVCWSEVLHAIPCRNPQESRRDYIMMSANNWKDMYEELDLLNRQKGTSYVLLGWYHTHPHSISAVYSSLDVKTHCAQFTGEYSIGAVFNPHKKAWSLYYGPSCQEGEGYLLLDERLIGAYRNVLRWAEVMPWQQGGKMAMQNPTYNGRAGVGSTPSSFWGQVMQNAAYQNTSGGEYVLSQQYGDVQGEAPYIWKCYILKNTSSPNEYPQMYCEFPFGSKLEQDINNVCRVLESSAKDMWGIDKDLDGILMRIQLPKETDPLDRVRFLNSKYYNNLNELWIDEHAQGGERELAILWMIRGVYQCQFRLKKWMDDCKMDYFVVAKPQGEGMMGYQMEFYINE